MAELWMNVPFARPSNVNNHATYANDVVQLGFTGVFIDISIWDVLGTPFVPPANSPKNFESAEATLTHYANKGLKVCFTFVLAPVDTASWSNAAGSGGSFTSRRFRWQYPLNMTVMDEYVLGLQQLIDRLTALWNKLNRPAGDLYIQLPREPGAGGANGLLNATSNSGKYDNFSDSAGTVADSGYCYDQYVAKYGEGYLDRDEEWIALGADLASGDATRGAEFALIRGWHNSMQHVFDRINWRGLRIIGPSMEHQISTGWFVASKPSSTLVSGTVASRERQTFFRSGFTWYNDLYANSINAYIGDHSSLSELTAEEYATGFTQFIIRACKRNSIQNPVHTRKPTWVTEVGIRSDWIASMTQEKRGEFWSAMIKALRSLTEIEVVGFYRLADYDGNNFGIYDLAGDFSIGAQAIYPTMGMPIPVRTYLE